MNSQGAEPPPDGPASLSTTTGWRPGIAEPGSTWTRRGRWRACRTGEALTIERFGEPATRRPAAGVRPADVATRALPFSHCINYCTYCGTVISRYPAAPFFRRGQGNVLLKRGFRHILLVGGEFPRLTTTEYYAQVIEWLTREGVAPAVEIAPQSTCHYARLAEAGACCVTLYQETYDETLYAEYHPKGSKASYDWRFEGLDRAADGAVGGWGWESC